jgi:hypothetical protein
MTTQRRLEIAARALMEECYRRSNSAHPMKYLIPFGRARDLQLVLDEIADERRHPRRDRKPFPLHWLAKAERRAIHRPQP